MATLNESSLQLRLDKRKGTISEVDRPQFEKEQTECIVKAIKGEETPAKEKHVRRTIIGTWQERGNSMFWTIIGRQPLPSQAVMCWKAMMVLHKILREGHPNVLKDSYVYRKTFRDLTAVYKFQGGIYSPLVLEYLKLLESKVNLHHKYPGLPGGLTFSLENPVKIPGRDINDVFTFGVEMLDYHDLLLSLQENIIQGLDKSRNNSNIGSSQCKIAPLVPLLKECAGMYDVLVQVLTKLHKNLPPDTLDGLRQRFYDQHRKLKTFCSTAGSMTYITSLTAIPNIPERPPDFLIHKFQPKQKREEPKEEPLPVAPVAQQVDERDVLIEQLMKEISELREHLDVTISQGKQMEDHLRMEILRKKEELRNLDEAMKKMQQENTFLREQLEIKKENDDTEERVKDADEKFNKLKGLYAKLRQEHIDLLRKHAETKQKEESAEKQVTELKATIVRMEADLAQKSKDLSKLQESDDSKVQALRDEIALLTEKLKSSEAERNALNEEIGTIKGNCNDQVRSLQEQLDQISSGKISEETARKNAEDTLNNLQGESQEIRKKLELSLDEMAKLLEEEKTKGAHAADEIARLLEQIAEAMKALEVSKCNLDDEMEKKLNLESDLQKLKEEFDSRLLSLSSELDKMKGEKDGDIALRLELESKLEELKAKFAKDFDDAEKRGVKDALDAKLGMLKLTATQCEKLITNALDLFNVTEHETGTTCSAEFLKTQLNNMIVNVQNTTQLYSEFHSTQEEVFPLISNLISSFHQLSGVLMNGKAAGHMATPQDCLHLHSLCKSIGSEALAYINDVREFTEADDIKSHGSVLEVELNKLIQFVEELLPKQSDSSDNVQNIVEEEMLTTEKIVEDAALRIEELLRNSRQTQSGVQLEVNEKILDACTELMTAIRELILKSKDLQDEIVIEGRGSASVKEYYKRHHKWAEGLLSAAKSVGWGASLLVNAADDVIEGKGKFEELIVASNEISASTVQLVAASRVKASPNSKRLPPLMKASKNVGHATAGVVAAVRSGSSLSEDNKTMPDYSKMTLTQAKRWEMDSQVKILELEDLLSKERGKLGDIRKAHYRIAVEQYGEDNVKMDV